MKWQYQSIVEVFSGSMGGTDEDNISILKSFVLDSSLHYTITSMLLQIMVMKISDEFLQSTFLINGVRYIER